MEISSSLERSRESQEKERIIGQKCILFWPDYYSFSWASTKNSSLEASLIADPCDRDPPLNISSNNWKKDVSGGQQHASSATKPGRSILLGFSGNKIDEPTFVFPKAHHNLVRREPWEVRRKRTHHRRAHRKEYWPDECVLLLTSHTAKSTIFSFMLEKIGTGGGKKMKTKEETTRSTFVERMDLDLVSSLWSSLLS